MNQTKSFSRLAACALVTAGMIASAAPSHAYRMIQDPTIGRSTGINAIPVTCSASGGFAHWNVANTDWYHNTASKGSGKAAALYNALNAWSFVTSANHTPTYRGTTSAGFSTDGVNAFSWGTGQGCSGNCLALTALVLQSGQVIVESDITFRDDLTWTTNGGNYDTWAVATHELGHALGIFHSEFSSSTMYGAYIGSAARSLEADDRSALQCSQSVYPPTVSCIPDGGVDDSGGNTSCCSGVAVNGSTYCPTAGNCFHICATPLVNGCVPSGGVDDTLSQTSCCSGAAVPGSTRCLDPADYGTDWVSCIHTCQ